MASKIDFKSAFCRSHLAAKTIIQCCTQFPVEELLLLYLHLTFGGCLCPHEWGAFSEPICDLANAIQLDDSWDPSTLHSSTQNLVSPPETLDVHVPFRISIELVIDIPVSPHGNHNIYIDDMIALSVDLPGTDNLQLCAVAGLLAIHTTAWPKHPNEPIPCKKMEARNKLLVETKLEETKIILGWHFDFLRFIISLPEN